jgi:hypothetical protein
MRNVRTGVRAPRAGPERRLNSGSSAASQPPHAINAGCRTANVSIACSGAGARGSLTVFAAASSCDAGPMRSKSTRSRPKDATVGMPVPYLQFSKKGRTHGPQVNRQHPSGNAHDRAGYRQTDRGGQDATQGRYAHVN